MDVHDNDSSDFDDVLSEDEASDCDSNFSWADLSANDVHFGDEPSDLSGRPLFDYGFSALKNGSFRLLKLLEGDSEPIRCQLIDAQFNQGEKYEALSYRWTSQYWVTILVDDQRISVTANVRNALQNMRHKTSYRLVWVDAICINQNDEKEKTHQVRQMTDIYKNAQRTVIWLGLGTYETDQLFLYLHEAIRNGSSYKYQDRNELREEWQSKWTTEEKTEQILGLRKLLENEWFRRVWIIQEVAQSRSAVIMCGDFLIPTNIFALLPYLLGIEPDSHCQKILEIMPGAREEISSPDPCDESRGSWAYPDLLILLRNFKDSKSTEPKDKVYALLGLSVQHKHDRLVLDYAKSEEQIVRDTITSIIPAYPAEFLPEWKLDQFLDSVDSLLQVLLILAVEEDYNSAVQQLLETKTIEVDWVNSDGCTALYRAADIGRVEAVKLLLETDKVDVNHLHIHTQKTPLSVAAYRRHDSIVEMILETGRVDIDMYGVSNGLMDWVLPRRPDVHVESQEHKVETMIKAGLVNFKDSRGRSMLSLSAQSNHANNIKLLLGTEGVDVNTKDHAGRTPLIFAVNEGGKDAVELLLEAEGVEIDTKDRDGRTPLSFAAQCGDTDIVELLLSKEGIEVDAKDNTMRTPLSWAAAERVVCFHTVRLLLESGKVDVNSTDQLERTPLSWASEGGDIEIVRLLLEKGKAEIDSKDLNGRSPLSTAHEYGHQDVVEILREQMPLG